MNRRSLVTFVALLALLALVAVVLITRDGTASTTTTTTTASPPLAGTTLQRTGFDLTQDRGQPTVVNFFASWCPACAAEAADIAAFANAHPEISVVGVAISDRRADVRRFVLDYRLPYTIVLDPSGDTANAWGVTGIPATFFLDAQGRITASIVGAATRDQFEEKLQTVR